MTDTLPVRRWLRRLVVAVGFSLLLGGAAAVRSKLFFGPSVTADPAKIAPERHAFRILIGKEINGERLRWVTLDENGAPLTRVSPKVFDEGRTGAFRVTRKNVLFRASDGSDPRTNGKTYTVHLKRPHLRIAWSILAGGLVLVMVGLGRERLLRFASPVGRAVLAVREGRAFAWLRGPEMPLSYAMARITAGCAIWFLRPSPGANANDFIASHHPDTYDPVGPFCFVCPHEPSAGLISFSQHVLPIASLCLAFGLLTRLSTVLTIFTFWVLASSYWIFGFICHGHTPFLLAVLPLLVARSDALSVDGWLRKMFRRPQLPPSGTRAAVIGMQAMAGLVFLSAALHKIYFGNGHFLRWVFSDSLHNLVLMQYLVLRAEVPDWLQWCIERPWVFRSMAAAAICCQSLPFIGIFFIKRPWLRLLCGVAIALEVRSLGVVMGLLPQQFMVFALVFVDWEYFTRSLHLASGLRWQPGYASRWRTAFATGLVAFEAVASVSWLNVRCVYPFTSFPMFSSVFARKPFDLHQPMAVAKSTWHVDSTPPLTDAQFNSLWGGLNELPWSLSGDPKLAANDVAAMIRSMLPATAGPAALTAFQINGAIFEVQPPPSTQVLLKKEAKFCEWRDGHVRCLPWRFFAENGRPCFEFDVKGFQPAQMSVAFVTIEDWKLHRVPQSLGRDLRKVTIQYTFDASPPRLDGDKLYMPAPGLAGTWILLLTRDAEGSEEQWSGPRLGM